MQLPTIVFICILSYEGAAFKLQSKRILREIFAIVYLDNFLTPSFITLLVNNLAFPFLRESNMLFSHFLYIFSKIHQSCIANASKNFVVLLQRAWMRTMLWHLKLCIRHFKNKPDNWLKLPNKILLWICCSENSREIGNYETIW